MAGRGRKASGELHRRGERGRSGCARTGQVGMWVWAGQGGVAGLRHGDEVGAWVGGWGRKGGGRRMAHVTLMRVRAQGAAGVAWTTYPLLVGGVEFLELGGLQLAAPHHDHGQGAPHARVVGVASDLTRRGKQASTPKAGCMMIRSRSSALLCGHLYHKHCSHCLASTRKGLCEPTWSVLTTLSCVLRACMGLREGMRYMHVCSTCHHVVRQPNHDHTMYLPLSYVVPRGTHIYTCSIPAWLCRGPRPAAGAPGNWRDPDPGWTCTRM